MAHFLESNMNVKLVEITRHDDGWKGSWYKTGQRHFVRLQPDYPDVYVCKWRALDVCGGIHENDCREVTGIGAWLRCAWKAMRHNAK